jgi:hypothetical protein
MAAIISIKIYIDKYQYLRLGCGGTHEPDSRSRQMNSDTNLAAWMIAGGSLAPGRSDERDRAHRLAISTAREALAVPSLASRIGAALTAFRAPTSKVEPACCPA